MVARGAPPRRCRTHFQSAGAAPATTCASGCVPSRAVFDLLYPHSSRQPKLVDQSGILLNVAVTRVGSDPPPPPNRFRRVTLLEMYRPRKEASICRAVTTADLRLRMVSCAGAYFLPKGRDNDSTASWLIVAEGNNRIDRSRSACRDHGSHQRNYNQQH
jgi:hypothetical protein